MILGFDPGATGGYALIGPLDGSIQEAGPMPRIGKEWDGDKIRQLVERSTVVALEWVNAGAVPSRFAAFSFGEGFGLLQGVAIGQRKQIEKVRPKAWQKDMVPLMPAKERGMRPANRKKIVKEACKAAAIRLWPNKSELIREMKDGAVDALLIAEWCRRNIASK